ncbi:polyprenyl synthetase family protein [Cellulosilyticum sp. I15G10I2]|uniref:polyprenyl synthetase family protein n=1 Tax=Cellulosilyticum sp. I15G10I2 TaxID=1892843 RepID=UPI00085C3409|nr:farnesyl diphosphate synthase [Cellulosilyticum sp. I15G10I2]
MRDSIKQYQELVGSCLRSALPVENRYFKTIYEAMNYSLSAGGKRIRPVLMQLAYEAVGGSEDISAYLCAIEMIHTYSLIHDDLPAMDDDALRRGMPTNHVVFGEAAAILAGDALLTEAFRYMLEDALKYGGAQRVRAAYILSQASGVKGMIGGQILDIESENKTIDLTTLNAIQLHKTGALIAAATKMGAVLGGGTEEEIEALENYGLFIGKTFQIIDDILDETSTDEELGKPIKSDQKNHKNTYLSFYTVEQCYEIAGTLTDKALSSLDVLKGNTLLLKEIAAELIKRRS